ncbi:MAG: SIS domain-containing protein [Labedaea sp.]
MSEILSMAMKETADRLLRLASDTGFQRTVERAGDLLADAFAAEKAVFACGNGGSMCDAMHFAEELSGRFRENRPPLPASAISDPAYLTCTANDFGYQHVFSRYLQAHARAGDVLIALSTSGRSANIIAAAETVRAKGGKVISLTGRSGSDLGALADVDLCVGTTEYADRAQEIHILLLHSLVQMVEQRLFAGVGADS